MSVLCLPRRTQRLFSAPVKSGRQRSEHRFAMVERNMPAAFEIQADFDAAGMKTSAPVKCPAGFEVMPLKTHSAAMHTAVQMPPAVANRAPHRTFGERRHDTGFGAAAGFD